MYFLTTLYYFFLSGVVWPLQELPSRPRDQQWFLREGVGSSQRCGAQAIHQLSGRVADIHKGVRWRSPLLWLDGLSIEIKPLSSLLTLRPKENFKSITPLRKRMNGPPECEEVFNLWAMCFIHVCNRVYWYSIVQEACTLENVTYMFTRYTICLAVESDKYLV